jgi:hypothetical protein
MFVRLSIDFGKKAEDAFDFVHYIARPNRAKAKFFIPPLAEQAGLNPPTRRPL